MFPLKWDTMKSDEFVIPIKEVSMNSSFISKYKPAIILTLTLAVFLTSCKSWVVSTLAGSGTRGHHDATGEEARFYYPCGVAVDSDGNVYVAELIATAYGKSHREGG